MTSWRGQRNDDVDESEEERKWRREGKKRRRERRDIPIKNCLTFKASLIHPANSPF